MSSNLLHRVVLEAQGLVWSLFASTISSLLNKCNLCWYVFVRNDEETKLHGPRKCERALFSVPDVCNSIFARKYSVLEYSPQDT